MGAGQQSKREQRGVDIQSGSKAGGDDQRGDGGWREGHWVLVLTTRRMLLAVHNNPAVIGARVCRAMNIVDSRHETALRREKRLPICIDLCVHGCGNDAIEIVIRHHFNKAGVAVWESYAQWQYLMAAMRSSTLRARRAHSDTAHHHVVHRLFRARTEQTAKLLIHLRRATLWHRNIVLRPGRR